MRLAVCRSWRLQCSVLTEELGQYLDGTTDATCTLHFGTSIDAQRRAFTCALQGYIAIDTVVFPRGV